MEFLPHILGGTALFTAFMVLYLLNGRLDPTAKLTWLIVIMLLPVFGALLYWYTQSDIGHRALKERFRQLEQARQFIFLEYFIVDEGLVWGRVLEILARKAAEGVDVRVMYDGTCEFSTLPHDYPKRLKQLGIACKMFAPVTPFVSTHYNYRDHRKILVIDGHTAFNGGVNLANEYINHIIKFGHWKDTAVILKGKSVKSFTLMFLQMWGLGEKDPEVDRFCPENHRAAYVTGMRRGCRHERRTEL